MKKIITIISIILGLTKICMGQVTSEAIWTKSDRENLYEDCLSYVMKYKSASQDQRESISLCYLEKITEKYGKNDFAAKIEIELKRIKESIITECSKNLGIALLIEEKKEPIPEPKKEPIPEPKKEVTPIASKKLTKKDSLIGKWNSNDKFTIEFDKNGKFKLQYTTSYFTPNTGGLVQENLKYGDYFIDGRGVVTLEMHWSEDIGNFKTKIRYYTKTNEYKLHDFNGDYFVWENLTYADKSVQFNRIYE
jgi:hypothetical protein